MKKIMPLIFVIVFVLSAFSAVGNSVNIKSTTMDVDSVKSFVISISFPDFEIVENNGKHSIEMDGYNYLLEPGKPLLLSKTFLIALPPDTIVQSVDILIMTTFIIILNGAMEQTAAGLDHLNLVRNAVFQKLGVNKEITKLKSV